MELMWKVLRHIALLASINVGNGFGYHSTKNKCYCCGMGIKVQTSTCICLPQSDLCYSVSSTPASSRINEKHFRTFILGRFGEGSLASRLCCCSLSAARLTTSSSSRLRALTLSVYPLKNLSLKRQSRIVASANSTFPSTSAYLQSRDVNMCSFMLLVTMVIMMILQGPM